MSDTPDEPVDERESATGLTETDRGRLLSVERRQVALTVLADRTPPVGLEELATEVVEREYDTETPSERAVTRAVVSLYRRHLPVLAELDVIDFDRESNRITSSRVGAATATG